MQIQTTATVRYRWLALYRQSGRLGFDENGWKQFVGRGVADMMYEIPIETIESIRIDRTDEHEYGLDGVYAFPTVVDDTDMLQSQKREYYQAHLFPRIQSILGL